MSVQSQTKEQPATQNRVAKQEEPISVRFTNMVVAEFTSGVGEVALTNFQKRLAQNYFIAVDQALAKAEQKRQAKKQNQDPLPVIWANVDMKQLALDVVSAARVGLDPAQANHVSPVPYKDNNTKKYVIVFIDGYRGIELKATKYGLNIPDSVTVELVYKNDHFRPIKKDQGNKVESYEFDIPNPFDRGEIVGGFYYHAYNENPTRNKLVMFTLKDILKRKPAYASVEFWGGEKDVWENGQKTGKKIHVDGWFEKMCHKTLYRAAFRDITIDSQKIDDDYLRLKQMEDTYSDRAVEEEIEANANGEYIDVEGTVKEENGESEDRPTVDSEHNDTSPPPEPPASGASGQMSIDRGPGF